MLKKYWNDPLYRFLTKAVFLYVIWYVLYDLFLHPQGALDMVVIRNLESLSRGVLDLIGFTTIEESQVDNIRTIGIDGTHGVWIGDPCNGLTLFALFTGFLLAYPGPIKHKLWFLPVGLLAIHLINVVRILGLALIVYFFPDPEVLDFNHTYTFTIFVYSFVFLLWYIWATKFVQPTKPAKDEKE
ncbi:MAG: archaeosortase/exosortase family protein [Flavobacteriales bacterium]|jgi:exosortase family protein XrtF|nr:archaeosortase/exosortase family protein [Flavobacteriales bacterium]MBT5183698.1 archaeosortase/exosortase family protein [Euryarchaeota archaeon]MBT3964455.1 archaeosortase/exosortase family protein [Flavobacteriales bacterium]MBT4704543.1 archaeosortase/exosortase family protein [Flavobacteriales bacterium]MBT6133526.1 archaeosortase/exosortase family protein [Flavobacteriales bacterium]